jgi:hypothetical protein
MTQFMQICVGMFMLFGFVVSIFSGMFWKKYKIFHLVPFVYAIVGYLVLRPFDTSHRFNWNIPFVEGIVFYAAAWLSLLDPITRKYRK